MKKILSALVLTSSLAILLAPALLVPTIVSAADCPNSCSVSSANCTCGGELYNTSGYCWNGVRYADQSACLSASGGTTGGGTGGYKEAPTLITSGQGLIDLITRVGNWLFSILLGVAAVMLILAGFFWVTAGGNPEGSERHVKERLNRRGHCLGR